MNGNVGYVISSMKQVDDANIGDTITLSKDPANDALSGYKDVKPMVFSGIYPVDTNDYEDLKVALEKLKLNDSSLTFDTESSRPWGLGFAVDFWALAHGNHSRTH